MRNEMNDKEEGGINSSSSTTNGTIDGRRQTDDSAVTRQNPTSAETPKEDEISSEGTNDVVKNDTILANPIRSSANTQNSSILEDSNTRRSGMGRICTIPANTISTTSTTTPFSMAPPPLQRFATRNENDHLSVASTTFAEEVVVSAVTSVTTTTLPGAVAIAGMNADQYDDAATWIIGGNDENTTTDDHNRADPSTSTTSTRIRSPSISRQHAGVDSGVRTEGGGAVSCVGSATTTASAAAGAGGGGEQRQADPVTTIVVPTPGEQVCHTDDPTSRANSHICSIRYSVAVIIIFLVVAIVIGIDFGVFQSNDDTSNNNSSGSGNKRNDETTVPTKSPSIPTPQSRLRQQISHLSGNDDALFEDLTTPQARALDWLTTNLLEVDNNKGILFLKDTERLETRYALAVLYYSTNGPQWEDSGSFLSLLHECDWTGIRCWRNGQVTWLELASNNLYGTLPVELAAMSESLERLNLAQNRLMGGVDDALSQLTSLKFLNLQENSLTGPMEFVGTLTNLQEVELDRNDLTGTIPTTLVQLTALRKFTIGGNSLVGSIPSDLGRMPSLEYFRAPNNSLSGTFPWASFSSGTSQITILSCGNNKLSGSLPSESLVELGLNLKVLDFDNAGLKGTIPSEMGQLVGLQDLRLAENFLHGELPSTLGLLTLLANLDLSQNSLSLALPTTLGNLTLLKYLDLMQNDFTGTLPSSLGNLESLTKLHLCYNSFVGTADHVCNGIPGLAIHVDCDASLTCRSECCNCCAV